MLEMWLNTIRLQHHVMAKYLEISRIVIKVGLEWGRRKREKREWEGEENGRRGEERQIKEHSNATNLPFLTFSRSEFRISERISFNLASLTINTTTTRWNYYKNFWRVHILEPFVTARRASWKEEHTSEKWKELEYEAWLTVTLYLNPSISVIRNWYGFTTTAAASSLVPDSQGQGDNGNCLHIQTANY